MRLSLVLTGLLVGSTMFIGCGGGGSGGGSSSSTSSGGSSSTTSSGGSSGSTSSGGSANWTPVTTNFTCDPEPKALGAATMDTKYAAEGDISAECSTQQGFTFNEYKVNAEFEATQVLVVEEDSGTVDGITYSSKETHDHRAGTIHIVENGGGHSLDCVETYATLLPLQIRSDSDLEDLMEFSPGRDMLTDTTCPDSYYEDLDNDGDDGDSSLSGSGVARINVTITDSESKSHKISQEEKFSK